jgi:hypothetical protein
MNTLDNPVIFKNVEIARSRIPLYPNRVLTDHDSLFDDNVGSCRFRLSADQSSV